MKFLPLIFILISFFGCKSQKEKDIIFIKDDLIKNFNDIAFKQNGKLSINNFEIVKLDTLRKGLIDSFLIIRTNDAKFNEIENILKLKTDEAKSSLNLLRLSVLADNSIMKDKYKEETQTLTNEIRAYADSLNEIIKYKESLLKSTSKAINKDFGYEVKTFFKGTMFIGKDSSNFIDTVRFYYTKDLKRIKEEDYRWRHNQYK